ncbi:MAG: hypothetical protein JWM05_2599 [Acidimicrobiales bacterium]|nr:hypothetical protein [Acidimicrobiales bacterium]
MSTPEMSSPRPRGAEAAAPRPAGASAVQGHVDLPAFVRPAATLAMRLTERSARVWSPTFAEVIDLGPRELQVLAAVRGRTATEAVTSALDGCLIVAGLIDAGLIRASRPRAVAAPSPPAPRPPLVDSGAAVLDGPPPRTGAGILQIHGVHDGEEGVPLAIGMLGAAAQAAAQEAGVACDQRPLARPGSAMVAEAAADDRPVLALFSCYLWSVEPNLAVAVDLKAARPDAVTVFGGPSVPKYEAETDEFLRTHPEVDVVVLGEGEDAVAELTTLVVGCGGRLPVERVLAEIAYGAEQGWRALFIADANFGMFPRDLEIARWIVEQARRCGAPTHVDATFAKKANDRVVEIVKLFSDAGLMKTGVLSLQSVDPTTVSIVRRDNIRTERYERLAGAFRAQQLPLLSDIMVGLPGSTPTSFMRDLDYCLRTGVKARVLSTELLPNSPMNAPDYRVAEQIEVNERGEVVASRTFDVDDRIRMSRLADLYWMSEHFHLWDEVLRFLAWDHGLLPMDVLDHIDRVTRVEPDRYPAVTFVARWFHQAQVAPVSWEPFVTELGDLVEQELHVSCGSDLATVLRVQHALLPLPGRPLPERIDLDHDWGRYRDGRADGRELGDRSGPRLADLPPGAIEVDDPSGRADRQFRVSGPVQFDRHGLPQWHMLEDSFINGASWDLRRRSARSVAALGG